MIELLLGLSLLQTPPLNSNSEYFQIQDSQNNLQVQLLDPQIQQVIINKKIFQTPLTPSNLKLQTGLNLIGIIKNQEILELKTYFASPDNTHNPPTCPAINTSSTDNTLAKKSSNNNQQATTANPNTNPTENTVSQPTAEIQANQLKIIEVMANSQNEYIVIKNQSATAIHTEGLYLTDLTNKTQKLQPQILKAQQTLKINKLNFTINNSNESIFLYTQNDKLIDRFEIKTSQKDIPLKSSYLQSIEEPNLSKDSKSSEDPKSTEDSNVSEDSKSSTVATVLANQNTAQETKTLEEPQQANSKQPDTTNSEQNQSKSILAKANQNNIGHTAGITPKLKITEVFANPSGSDKNKEFIEIHNYGSQSINLENISLTVNSKSLKLSGRLPANAYQAITTTAVPNAKATIQLVYQNKVLSKITYSQTLENYSLIKHKDTWYQSSIVSKGGANPLIIELSGAAVVEDQTIFIQDLEINIKKTKLKAGTYTKLDLVILNSNGSLELLEVLNSQIDPTSTISAKALKATGHTQESNSQNISGFGLLSMASLAIIYALLKI